MNSMSEITQIALLAVIQGITEFLPVSSSGHLVLIGHLIDFQEQGNMTEVVLHAGTFIAVIVYFWKKLIRLLRDTANGSREARVYAGAIIIGTIPVVAAYALAGDHIEALFDKPIWSGAFLCVTGAMLLSLKFLSKETGDITTVRGGAIGLAQACALLPGISRSGSTIVAARHLGVAPAKAAEFSFLLYLPAMLGAILIKASALFRGTEAVVPLHALIGILVSACVGYFSLALLISAVKRGKLWLFGFYCIAAGAASILLLIF